MKSVLVHVIVIFHYTCICYAMDPLTLPIIPSAAYFIIKGNEKAIVPKSIENLPQEDYATFYTALGVEIKKISQRECPPSKLKELLDPNAPKPKAVSWDLKYWPAPSLASGKTKVPSGYHIVLSDKYGNHIISFPYNHETHKIIVSNDPLVEVDEVSELEDFDTKDCIEIRVEDVVIGPNTPTTLPSCCAIL